jgi:hypothetical protein
MLLESLYARKFNSAFRETTKGMSDEEVLAAARASEKLEGRRYQISFLSASRW